MKNKIIHILPCDAFREEYEEYMFGESEPGRVQLIEEHLRFCEDCRNFAHEWSEYFQVIGTYRDDVTVSREAFERVKTKVYHPIYRIRYGIRQFFMWWLQPVQTAGLLFLLIILGISFMRGEPETTSAHAYFNLVEVRASRIVPYTTKMTYTWDNVYKLRLTQFPVVFECINAHYFNISDPSDEYTFLLTPLYGLRTHRQFLETWCKLIPGGLGTVTCEENTCRMEITPYDARS